MPVLERAKARELNDDILPHPGRKMTEEEFVAWCNDKTKAEWVDGEVIIMSPASGEHVDYAFFLMSIMHEYAAEKDLGLVRGTEFLVRLRVDGKFRRRVPDIIFVAKPRLHILRPNHAEGAPDLVVEIVSEDSTARDWRDKYLDYQAAGVREYWIVDPLSKKVEAYSLGRDRKYRLIAEQAGVIRSSVLPGFFLKPAWLWQSRLPRTKQVLRELGVG
ncbi:MAG: Uma2 family endonuclease [Planctomycetota bacterium]|nr:Uma2 family endonuclease [Planctomycetota bacterium]